MFDELLTQAIRTLVNQAVSDKLAEMQQVVDSQTTIKSPQDLINLVRSVVKEELDDGDGYSRVRDIAGEVMDEHLDSDDFKNKTQNLIDNQTEDFVRGIVKDVIDNEVTVTIDVC